MIGLRTSIIADRRTGACRRRRPESLAASRSAVLSRETLPLTPELNDYIRAVSLRPGMKVRHAQFGVGTVVSVEALNDDTKLVVRFTQVGVKTLRAKFAKLEVA